MPSITHEGPLDLVRQYPEIALELISGTVGVTLPATVAVSDMSAVVPVQYLVLCPDPDEADRCRKAPPGGDDHHGPS